MSIWDDFQPIIVDWEHRDFVDGDVGDDSWYGWSADAFIEGLEFKIDSGTLVPGTIPDFPGLDVTPPAVPGPPVLNSEIIVDANGQPSLVLIVTIVQPTDDDLFGTYVELTSVATDANPNLPSWDRPTTVFIPVGSTSQTILGILGGVRYWARARSVDQVGNLSAYSTTVEYTTGRDNVAPPLPQAFAVLPAFRGFMATWDPSTARDMQFFELRYSPDNGSNQPTPDAWSLVRARATGVFVGNLEPDQQYWVQVRAVDTSGNTVTSPTNDTAVDYLDNPEAGWTDPLPVTPTLIGAVDLAANSITAAMIRGLEIYADDITAGTLRISPQDAFADGIEILSDTGSLLGRWDEHGLRIVDPTDGNRYMLLDAGELRFTQDAGETFPTAVTPEGINASAINFGAIPGGHNLVLNSSFELAGFVEADSVQVHTDTTRWTAAHRTVAPENITEGTELSMTAAGWV